MVILQFTFISSIPLKNPNRPPISEQLLSNELSLVSGTEIELTKQQLCNDGSYRYYYDVTIRESKREIT